MHVLESWIKENIENACLVSLHTLHALAPPAYPAMKIKHNSIYATIRIFIFLLLAQ